MQKKQIYLVFILILFFINLYGCSHLPKQAPSVSSKTSADATYHYSLGVLLRLDGKIEEATNELKQAIAADPDSSYLTTELVSLYTEQGDLNGAISLGEAMLSKNPDNIELHRIMGGLYLNIHENKKAITEHKKVIELDPKNLMAHLYLAIIYAEEKRFDKSEETFKNVENRS